jgi:ATPase family associated with various cellular activities (AAA)
VIDIQYVANSPYDALQGLTAQWLLDYADHSIFLTGWRCGFNVARLQAALHEISAATGMRAAILTQVGNSLLIARGPGFLVQQNAAGLEVHHTSDHAAVAILRRRLPSAKASDTAKWWFNGGRGPEPQVMPLCGADPSPQFYPWIEDLAAFYQGFANSDSNVLILQGPPGTGKTTFTRGLLRAMDMEAWLTYDPDVQKSENLYVQFAASTNYGNALPSARYENDPEVVDGRVLVLEDADEMLEARTDGNKLMARMLNLSDGLISFPKRKLIFSTNLPSLNSVDQALLRPGRCYDVVKFRPLTAEEAVAAAGAIGRTLCAEVGRTYTLSEALNGPRTRDHVARRVGF